MGTKRVKAQDLSEAAIVERSRSLGNSWMFAVGLEHARITKPRPQDKAFHPFDTDSFNEADVHFLAIALHGFARSLPRSTHGTASMGFYSKCDSNIR